MDLFTVLAGLLLLYALYRFGYAPYRVLQRCGIKGPKPIPFFGNYLELNKLGRPAFEKSLYDKFGPIYGYYLGQLPCIVVADTDIIKEIVIKQHECFMNRRDISKIGLTALPNGLLFAQGERWKYRRSTITPTFTAAKMKLMTPLIESSVNTLVDVVSKNADTGKSIEFYKTFSAYTLEIVLAIGFGRAIDVQRGKADSLTEATHKLTQVLFGKLGYLDVLLSNFPWIDPLVAFFLKENPSLSLLRSTAVDLANARRTRKTETTKKDFLQLVIDAVGEETVETADGSSSKRMRKLTEEEVALVSLDFLLAGYETTASSLSFAAYQLALNPDIQKKLQVEIDDYYEQNPETSLQDAALNIEYLEMVIQEIMRICPIAYVMGRICNKATTIQGVHFPKGAFIIFPAHLLYLDSRFWKDPEKFDPMRFTAEEIAKRPQLSYMPFGAGPRSCIGTRLAQLEIKMTLTKLLRHFTLLKGHDTEVPLQKHWGVTMSPANGVYLNVAKR